MEELTIDENLYIQNKCQKIKFDLVCLSHRVKVLGFGCAKNGTRTKND